TQPNKSCSEASPKLTSKSVYDGSQSTSRRRSGVLQNLLGKIQRAKSTSLCAS
ncbi:unnamed protein product, partial [Candidula unifasciata]